jgi:hypothetical protein
MGRETRCMAEIEDWAGDGRLLLETDELIFRGARRLVVPRQEIISARDEDGWLALEYAGGTARFDLGTLTPSWVNAITHPRSRVDKLDVKDGSRIALIGALDEDFLAELRTKTDRIGETADGSAADLIFFRIDTPADLVRLPSLRELIRPAGGIWIVHPKGQPALGHEVIAAAARAAGLVDTKSARFSDTHSALRLSIPRSRRS